MARKGKRSRAGAFVPVPKRTAHMFFPDFPKKPKLLIKEVLTDEEAEKIREDK